MEINQQMYQEFYQLRQKLKEQGRITEGRAPLVCSDDALYEIARLRPKKISDFEGITGIGETFIQNYASQFLSIILKYESAPNEKLITMSASTQNTLKELEKKLVSINRRNRLLYMAKIRNKVSYDLYDPNNNFTREILFGSGVPITVCDIVQFTPERVEEESLKYKKLVQLIREVNKGRREKGQNDFYIAYPFVIGRLPGEDFDVRAPLALFPVTAIRNPGNIKLCLDASRDVIYNNTLLLAYFKFNQISKPLPTDSIEDYTEDNLLSILNNFYGSHGLNLQYNGELFQKFKEYKADEFPKFSSGELFIEPCAVLGKFPTCESSIQKDFDTILQSKQINNLVNDLLINVNDIDFYAEEDTTTNKDSENANHDISQISEHDLLYINDVNSSQEAVLAAVDKQDKLVMQGPPGTGKSQTITSLISNFVCNGKTVLMVSEKKTALDVVYSRLGHLSQYALLIDDVGNKDAFYQQLLRMVTQGTDTNENPVDLNNASNTIDTQISRLEKIAEKLYTPTTLGIATYELYLKNKRFDLSDAVLRAKVQKISQTKDPSLMALSYPQLEQIQQEFSDPTINEKLEQFFILKNTYPWLESVRNNISEYEILTFEGKLNDLNEHISIWKSKNFFIRFFTKRKLIAEIKTILKEYFNASDNPSIQLLLNQIDQVRNGIQHYMNYQELKPLYDRLSSEGKVYFQSVIHIKNGSEESLESTISDLYNVILYEHISKFEAENRELFQDIHNFESIVSSLSAEISKKKELTKEKLAGILAESMQAMLTSKRHGEILRVLESKRKWNVNKFIKKFDFELFKSVKIWLLTPEVVSEIIPLQAGIFDLVVFDEASQMYVEKGIPSILRAKKVVIAGDHKQLRPSSLGAGRVELELDELPEDEEITAALEEESLLDLARFKYDDILLNFHYRSKYEELIAFSNYAFYKGQLYVSPNVKAPEQPPIQVHKMEQAVWSNRSNLREAQYIVNMLKQFFNERKNEETVGIITFNTNQRDLIDDLIDEECAKDSDFATKVTTEIERRKDGEDIGLFVKNIESVQGDERDVIIFSIGYANNEEGKFVRNFGWLNQRGGENRLNVAISRAKRKVHIVTSFDPAELEVDDMKNDGPRILKKYLEYAFAISNGDKVAAKQVLLSFQHNMSSEMNHHFDSQLEGQIYEALTAKGYEVDKEIGIGGYSIGLAVKKNNEYILGIECDDRLYHNSKSARERDYHRQKYLEIRGWNIYRVWSSNWWKDKDAELDKICARIDSTIV